MACIIANTIVMGLVWYDLSSGMTLYKERINLVFMIIFTLEAIIKIVAM